MAAEKQFPLLTDSHRILPTLPRSVPWWFVEPHEKAAQRNHSQSLTRLSERGGLCWSELRNVVTGAAWDGRAFSNRDDPALIALEALAARHVLMLLESAKAGREEATQN